MCGKLLLSGSVLGSIEGTVGRPCIYHIHKYIPPGTLSISEKVVFGGRAVSWIRILRRFHIERVGSLFLNLGSTFYKISKGVRGYSRSFLPRSRLSYIFRDSLSAMLMGPPCDEKKTIKKVKNIPNLQRVWGIYLGNNSHILSAEFLGPLTGSPR